jgi:hypothetical protein
MIGLGVIGCGGYINVGAGEWLSIGEWYDGYGGGCVCGGGNDGCRVDPERVGWSA